MILVGYKLHSVMVKPHRQTDKLKKAPKEEQDLSLPPPMQLLEKKMAVSTPAKKVDETSIGDKQSQSGASAPDSHNGSFDEDVIDLEIAETEKSIRETQARLDDLEKTTRVQAKKDQLSKMKARLEKSQQKLQAATEKGEKKQSSSTSKTSVIGQLKDSCVKAADLRDNAKLKKKANRKLKSLGLLSDNEQSADSSSDSVSESSDDFESSESESRYKSKSKKSHRSSRQNRYFSSDSDSSGSSDSSEHSKKAHRSHKSKKKSKKSGMSRRASDKVKYPQVWPHTVLQYEFVSEHVSFKKLDIKMFFSGELEILTSKISKTEFRGRLKFLKKIAYYANIYDWSQLLHYYAAWLRRIEMGLNTWSDEPSQIENAMLTSKMLKSKPDRGYLSQSDQTWWCPDFNNNKCSFQTFSHQKSILGHPRMVRHICGTCWKKEKKQLRHPECSTACPYKA